MPESVVKVGDKLHIITRRRFESDVRRHFAGEVIANSGDLLEIKGYAFVYEMGKNEYRRRPELRTRLIAVGQEGFIITKLPAEIDVSQLHYRIVENRLVVTDGGAFMLDVNEFGIGR